MLFWIVTLISLSSWWRCRRDDVVYREVQQMELMMMKAVVTEWTVVMWWTV